MLIPVILLLGKKAPQPIVGVGKKKDLILGGVLCGTALFAATTFQQIGITLGKNSGKAGFITAMYIIIVPIIGIFLGNRINIKIIASILLSVAGLYLLCIQGGNKIQSADILLLISALFFSVHILTIDRFAPRVECVKMACIQFFVCGIWALIFMFATGEQNTLSDFKNAAVYILYLGIMSSGVGYTLQIVGQRGTNPTVACIIMSLESVFAVIAGVAVGEPISFKEIVGCVLMFTAIIISQLPNGKKVKIVYFGFDLFYDCFKALVKHPKVEIVALYTYNTDNVFEFNKKIVALAKRKIIPVFYNKITKTEIEKYFADGVFATVSAGYIHKIPVLDQNIFKGVNVHPSLLPVGRGAWPYPTTILKGLTESGVTLHKLADGFDTGDIILQSQYPVAPDETLDSLTKKSQKSAKQAITKLFNNFMPLWQNATPQTDGEYWREANDADRTLSETQTCEEARRIIRAFGSYGVIYNGEIFKNSTEKFKTVNFIDGSLKLHY